MAAAESFGEGRTLEPDQVQTPLAAVVGQANTVTNLQHVKKMVIGFPICMM